MSDFIITADGQRFHFADPESYIPDLPLMGYTIAHVNRFGGNGRTPYSVATHSIVGTRFLLHVRHDEEAARAFLLHDLHEALVGDLFRPMKPFVPGYQELERRVERHVQTCLLGAPICCAAKKTVKDMDTALVMAEARLLGLDDGWVADALNAIEAADSSRILRDHTLAEVCRFVSEGLASYPFGRTAHEEFLGAARALGFD